MGQVTLEGQPRVALLDTGSGPNLTTPTQADSLGVEVRPLEEITSARRMVIEGVGGKANQVAGWCLVQCEIDGIAGYCEDQIFLVMDDPTLDSDPDGCNFIIGRGTLLRAFALMKESEKDSLPPALQAAHWATQLSARMSQQQALPAKKGEAINQDPLGYEEHVRATSEMWVEPFATAVLHARTTACFNEGRLNVMTHALPTTVEQDRMPHGLMTANTYTYIKKGSKRVAVVVHNTSSIPLQIRKGDYVATVATANKSPLPSRMPKPPASKLHPKERQKILLEKLDLQALEEWEPELKRRATELLLEFHDVFSVEEWELGHTTIMQHKIKLKDKEPFKERFRRIPEGQMQEVREHIQGMLQAGAIQPSQSPWTSNVVLARKKNGGLRFCIDFRRLNAKSEGDAFPLPRIQESLDKMAGARCFSSLDMKQGFWQVELDPESRPYTAFTVGPLGLFECLRMPFGLTTASATYQRAMNTCLGPLVGVCCLVYLDDVLVYSPNNAQHLEDLRRVLIQLRKDGFLLRPAKCNFFAKEVEYLAHKIKDGKLTPSDANVRAIKEIAVPKTYTDVRAVLGMLGHYRKFIKNFRGGPSPSTTF